MTWLFSIATLVYADQLFSMLLFGNWHADLQILDLSLVRWPTVYRFSILRMISFNLDAHWALLEQQRNTTTTTTTTTNTTASIDSVAISIESDATQPHAASSPSSSSASSGATIERLEIGSDDEQLKRWERQSHAVHYYHYAFYIAYVLYAPLTIAGPIVSANAFMAQVFHHQWRISRNYILFYVARWVLYVLVLELAIHHLFVFAAVNSGAFVTAIHNWLTVAQTMNFGFIVVELMWFKFLVIWRFFRLWCLLDNMQVPENMTGCINSNYTIRGFWRVWHSSFNRYDRSSDPSSRPLCCLISMYHACCFVIHRACGLVGG
jgi:protein-cysteine N-palmitoyltransferase HHAT